jgi:hypothetical protein
MANLLEQAIECNDGDHAAKIIQHEASRRCRSLMRPTGERLWAKRRSHRCLVSHILLAAHQKPRSS